MAKLFVSYSRRDSVTARKLIEAFRSIDQDVWVDWESIPPAVDWLEQIFRGIEESDAFIFLISPDSIASEVCKVELNWAAQNNKRIIPIVLRDVHAKDTPESIRKLNWTFLRETDAFEEGLAKAKTAIELDLDWLEEHRRLQVRALEWHRKNDTSLLLHGRDLRNAHRMIETATSKDPTPTDLQKTFILHSRKNERNRTIAWVASGLALVIMAVLSIIAVNQSQVAQDERNAAETARSVAEAQKNIAVTSEVKASNNASTAQAYANEASTQRAIANENEKRASAGRSAARAQISQSRPGELYASTLLAIDSMQKNPSREAEDIMRRNISLLPFPVGQVSQSNRINALAFHPEGGMFVTASADGSTCAWNAADGTEIFCTPANQSSVNAVAFSPDGTFIVTGDQTGLVRILDAQTGDEQHVYQPVEPPSGRIDFIDLKTGRPEVGDIPLEQPVRSISIQPLRGRQVAVAFEDGQIPVFNPENGSVSSPLYTGGGRPNVAGFSPNGVWVVAGSDTGDISVWNLSSSGSFPNVDHRRAVLAIAFSPRENKVATGGNDNIVRMISLQGREVLFSIPIQSPVRDLALSPDGTWLVTVSEDHRIRVWDSESGGELLTMTQDGIVTDVAVSPDGQWIASTGEDRTTRLWDAVTGVEIFQIPLASNGARVAFGMNGERLVSTDQGGAIDTWDISGLAARIQTLSFEETLDEVQYSPSGERLAVSEENQVWLLRPDVSTGRIASPTGSPTIVLEANVREMIFSPDSSFLAIVTEADEASLYGTANPRQPVREFSSVKTVAFSSDNQQFIAADLEGKIQAWNALNGELIEDTNSEYPQTSSLATSSGILAFGFKDKIWVVGANGKGGRADIEAPGENTLLALNNDGSWLASTDSSGRFQIWKSQNSEYTSVITFDKEPALSLALNPEGNLLAIGTSRYVFLVDPASGNEIARIPHRYAATGVSFSADGKYLATASHDLIQVWEIAKIEQIKYEELIKSACSRLSGRFTQAQVDALLEDPGVLCEDLLIPQ
jgi:WD40 repeat protein